MCYKMYFYLKNLVSLFVDKEERKNLENTWHCGLVFLCADNVNNNAREGDDVPEGEMNPMNGPHHHIHNEYEPILSRASYDLPPPDGADSQKRVRKVAAAPTVPSYKGNGGWMIFQWKYTRIELIQWEIMSR